MGGCWAHKAVLLSTWLWSRGYPESPSTCWKLSPGPRWDGKDGTLGYSFELLTLVDCQYHSICFKKQNATDNEIFGPHALCMLLLKCHPWVTQPTNGLLIKFSNCQSSSLWREAWRQHLLWERETDGLTSQCLRPQLWAEVTGRRGCGGSPVHYVPARGDWQDVGVARPQQLFHFGLSDCWRKWELEWRERRHETVPWRRPHLNTKADSEHISGACLFFSESLLGNSSLSPSWIHTAFVSMVEQVPGLSGLHPHLRSSSWPCSRLTFVWEVLCALTAPSPVLTITPSCAVCICADVPVFVLLSPGRRRLYDGMFSQLTARGTKQAFCLFSQCS